MKTVKVIFFNLALLITLFLGLEMGFRVIHPDYQYYERTYVGQFETGPAQHKLDTNWVKPEIDLGWVCKNKTNLNFYDSSFHHISYSINPQGFRNPPNFDSLRVSKSKKRILLLGDSFLFGIFLKEEATIQQQLQLKLGGEYEIISMAVPGWGLDQMYLAYQKHLDQIQPDQVIVFLIDDDVSRTIEALYWGAATKPAFKLTNDQLKLREAPEQKIRQPFSAFVFNSQIINHLYHAYCLSKAKPIADAIFTKWKQAEKAASRELKVLHYPRIEQVNESVCFHYDFTTNFRKENYQKVDTGLLELSEAQRARLYLPKDGHPSEEGAAFIAEIIANLLD